MCQQNRSRKAEGADGSPENSNRWLPHRNLPDARLKDTGFDLGVCPQEPAARKVRISFSMDEPTTWPWIETQVSRTADLWTCCARLQPEPGPRYSLRDHESRELAYDAELAAVEWEAGHSSNTIADRATLQNRIVASFARFAADALDLESEATAMLTHGFLPAGIDFARRARQFDPTLSQQDTMQACRNAWTACGLQPLLGERIAISSSILAYSLLYPYSDNYLDRADVPSATKIAFCRRFRDRLSGGIIPPLNRHESAIWALVTKIESQYPRVQFPAVYDCLLAIHQAQENSVAQLSDGAGQGLDLLRISLAKGGASVLADAALVRGWMTGEESVAAFEWGALLQLGDDLQDIRDDLRRGSSTLFTRAIGEGQPLDRLVVQLLSFCDCVGARMDRLPAGSQRFKNLLRMSWRSLIVGAIAGALEFFTKPFVAEMERSSPFRFEFLRSRRQRLAARQGLFSVLFDLFVNQSHRELGAQQVHFSAGPEVPGDALYL